MSEFEEITKQIMKLMEKTDEITLKNFKLEGKELEFQIEEEK